jgi:FG-GAP-like repeat
MARRPAPAKEFGLINRVRYRIVHSGPAAVEREPVAMPDPQKGTQARPASNGTATWIRETITAAPTGAQIIGWGDFDNDGSDELLIGWPAVIYKRTGDGKWVQVGAVTGLKRATGISIVDTDDNGLADIVSADPSGVTLFRNETELPWVRHVIARGFRNQTAAAGDFAGAGRMDVISGDIENDRKITLFRAPDWKPTLLRSGIRVIQSAALDVDGDGLVDYIGAQYRPGLIFWLQHPKNPSDPWTYHLIDDFSQGGVDGVHGLALADLDGDGRPELLATSGWTDGDFPDSIAWFRIPKDPRTAVRWERFIAADRDAPGFGHYLGVGDVNRDGRLDVASAGKSGPLGNWFAWWEQPAELTKPWIKHLISRNQEGATNILIADLNGDGRPDFLASRGHGAGVVWFEAPDWKAHEINTSYIGPHGLAVGDLNGDGLPDFAVCAKDSGILAWFENLGHGEFAEHRLHEDQSTYEVRLVDMNGDGALDILVAGQESQNVVWYENRMHPGSRRR